MNMKRLGAIAAAVLVSGALLTGGAMAANLPSKMADKLQSQVQAGKMTQAQADVFSQLFNLRQDAMTKLKADEKALIDQAIKDGKVTQDQANKLRHDDRLGGFDRHDHGRDGKGDRQKFSGKPFTAEQLKAKLDTAVKSGKLTQERADAILKKFAEHQAQKQTKPEAQPQTQSGQ